jgi:small subunit ribosomal protein S1
VGEKVRVKVLSIDAAPTKSGQRRISLSMKALQQPEAKERSVAQVLDATVVKVEQFGLLVETPSGSGLVPTAEIGLPPGSDPRRAYKPGDTLQVALLHKDGGGKLRFSAKAVEEVEANRAFEAFRQDRSPGRGSMGSLGDLLKGKLKLGG